MCRCAVVGCYITEDYFLEREGVFLLLDLLEVTLVYTVLFIKSLLSLNINFFNYRQRIYCEN